MVEGFSVFKSSGSAKTVEEENAVKTDDTERKEMNRQTEVNLTVVKFNSRFNFI